MPVSSLLLFLGLDNVWLCYNIKSIAYLKYKYTYKNFFYLFLFVTLNTVFEKLVTSVAV